jgi:DNA modification methylase
MAKKLGRHYLGFDISQEYISITKERLKGVNNEESK